MPYIQQYYTLYEPFNGWPKVSVYLTLVFVFCVFFVTIGIKKILIWFLSHILTIIWLPESAFIVFLLSFWVSSVRVSALLTDSNPSQTVRWVLTQQTFVMQTVIVMSKRVTRLTVHWLYGQWFRSGADWATLWQILSFKIQFHWEIQMKGQFFVIRVFFAHHLILTGIIWINLTVSSLWIR